MAAEAEAQALTDADFGGAPTAPAPAAGTLTDADFMQPAQPSVSQPPIKQATTYLSDKNAVIGHPADMSHDQVNDAIQTQIYGRPRNDLHENAPTAGDKIMRAFGETAGLVIPGTLDPATAEKAAVEGGKGLIRGTEDVGKGLAGLVKWLGASMESPGVDATGKPLPAREDVISEGVRAIGSKFTEVGQKAINFLKQREELGFEAPDPEIFRASFVSNPSFARLVADVAQGVPALGAAALTTIATGNPIAGAGALGLIGAGQQFEASQEEGSSLGRSAVAATASGIGNTILMALPLGDAMKGFEATGMKAVVKGAAEFGGATAVLTPFNNIVAKIGGDKARQLFDGMTESILAGAVSGGILGAFAPGRGGEIDGMVQDAHKAGVSARDIDGARSEIAKQMKENPDAIEKAITAGPANEQSRSTEFRANLLSIKEGVSDNAQIHEIPGDIAKARRIPQEVFIDQKAIDKIEAKHGPIKDSFVDNLTQANQMVFIPGEEGRVNYIRDLGDGRYGITATKRFNGHWVVTGFETKSESYINNLRGRGEVVDITGRTATPSITPVDKTGLPAGLSGVSEPTDSNLYVKNRDFKIGMGENDKTTAKSIREEFAGIKNEQIVRGNQLADEIRRILPKEKDREGLFWFKAANGDTNQLAEALNDPALSAYHDQIKAALNLPPKAAEALQKVTRYYDEAGQVAQDIGTISNVRENYQNRIYAPDKPQDFVKTEVKSGIKQTTRHAKARVFDTEFDAARAGKTFATTDVADALSIHNEELARVNTSRKMAEAMADSGLGAWKREKPEGWTHVGNLEKRIPIKDKDGNAVIGEDGNQVVSQSKFYAPDGIAKALEAITKPDATKQIPILRELQRFQSTVKRWFLSFSFFHHLTMVTQALSQGVGGSLMDIPTLDRHLSSPDFGELEQDFVRNTGMTASVEANQDVMRSITAKNPDVFDKVLDLPVVQDTLKPALTSVDKLAEKNSQFLFGKMQRFLKVTDYGSKISNWLADNPEATNAEVAAAKKGFAKEINAAYGGLNWEALGMTKTNLSLLRLILLAPDWTISNGLLGKYFVGNGVLNQPTETGAARANIFRNAAMGIVATEVLNKVLTGHFTDKNKRGHALEIEVQPDVYVSLFRGGIGDYLKLGSNIAESGPIEGPIRFSQGKLAPILRTVAGAAYNVQYTGAPIAKRSEGPYSKTIDYLKYILSSATPIPLGLSNAASYLSDEKHPSASGGLAVATGLARYSRSKRSGR